MGQSHARSERCPQNSVTGAAVESQSSVQDGLERFFDLAVALVGAALLLLLLPPMALLIKFDSRGPIFYRCKRVGKNRRVFKMYKFRTMFETTEPLGGSVSPQEDPRVTPIGRILRRTKLNEFPQFINVLKGDMSIVGPRPEAPDLAAAYPPEALPIFSVRPGLVGPNQIVGRNEEEFYPQGVDPVDYYIKEILPKKLPVDLKYVRSKSFLKDVKYLFLGVWATVSGALTRKHLADNSTQLIMIAADSIMAILSFQLAYLIRFGTTPLYYPIANCMLIYLLAVITCISLMLFFKCYDPLIRYICVYDITTVFFATTFGSATFILSAYMCGIQLGNYGRIVFLSYWAILSSIIIGYRIAVKLLSHFHYKVKLDNVNVMRTIIWGAGEEGYWCLRFLLEYKTPCYKVIGFIDDDKRLHNRRINGVKVLGDYHHLEALIRLYKVQYLCVARPLAYPSQISHAHKLCSELGIVTMYFYPRMATEIHEGLAVNSF